MSLCKLCGAKLLLKLGFLQFKLVHLFQECVCSAFNKQIHHIVELCLNTSYLTLQFRNLVRFHSRFVCVDHLLGEYLLFPVHIQKCKHLLAHIPFKITLSLCFLGALWLSLTAVVVVLLAVLRGPANGYELFSAFAAVQLACKIIFNLSSGSARSFFRYFEKFLHLFKGLAVYEGRAAALNLNILAVAKYADVLLVGEHIVKGAYFELVALSCAVASAVKFIRNSFLALAVSVHRESELRDFTCAFVYVELFILSPLVAEGWSCTSSLAFEGGLTHSSFGFLPKLCGIELRHCFKHCLGYYAFGIVRKTLCC